MGKSDLGIRAFKTTAIILIIVGGLTLVLTLSFFVCKTSPISTKSNFDTDVFGNYGSLIGGTVGALWSLAGVFLFYAALGLQREDLLAQKEEFELTRKELTVQNKTLSQQRFENTFFHLLTLHNDIVDKLSIAKPDKRLNLERGQEKPKLYLKRDLFEYAVDYLFEQNGMLSTFDDPQDYDRTINEAYIVFNYKFSKHLNHYFRNLYHIYRYIFHTALIGEDQKQFYANIVRAQLSDNELIIIFYNMFVPDLGHPNFKFLDQEYDILKHLNLDDDKHQKVFYNEIVSNPFK